LVLKHFTDIFVRLAASFLQVLFTSDDEFNWLCYISVKSSEQIQHSIQFNYRHNKLNEYSASPR